jgi:hypothetical protein
MSIKTNKLKLRPRFVDKVTFGFAAAITLYPFGIYFNSQRNLNKKRIVNHECVHWEQSKELLGIFFYVIYGLEWLCKLLVYGREAYYNISFEREANAFENDDDYLKTRSRYSWIYFL